MLTNAPSIPATASHCVVDRHPPRPLLHSAPLSFDWRSRLERMQRADAHGALTPLDRPAAAIDPAVEISPPGIVKRRAVAWDGMAAEIVQATRCERVEYRFRAQRHLLAVYERGVRRDGETLVEGLPRSTLRDFRHKLTFLPAGHEYREWQQPHTPTRAAYFYFDPAKMPPGGESDPARQALKPRLFFEDATLWNTALKLKALIEGGPANRLYLEALGNVLAHEIVRLNAPTRGIEPQARGGLAAWQERTVTSYIEEHVAEHVPLATLAQLIRLSPYYFCRAFKQSFGLPPHRYHNERRIELAKTLLAKPMSSVTEIGLAVGFSETSSFTAAFRKTTGLTPTAYRRSLA